MLLVCSPLRIETASSFPFHTDMRSNVGDSTSHIKQESVLALSSQSSTQSSVDWKSAPSSTSSTNSAHFGEESTKVKAEPASTGSNYILQGDSHPSGDVKLEAIVPSQSQPPSQTLYQGSYYPSADYTTASTIAPQSDSTHYMSQRTYPGDRHPYASQSHPAIHDRGQPSMIGQQKYSTSPNLEYPVHGAHPPSGVENITAIPSTTTSINISQSTGNTWDTSLPLTQDVHGQTHPSDSSSMHLPPLSEALNRIPQNASPIPPQQPMTPIDNAMLTTAPPMSYYTQVPIADVPPAVMFPTQDAFTNDPSKLQATASLIRHGSVTHAMMPQNSNDSLNQNYNRRVTYPFVPSIDTSTGLLMTNMTSPETSGSSPLMGSPFANGGMIGVNPVPVQNMVRSSPLVGYMDAMTLQSAHPSQSQYPQSLHQTMPHHTTSQPGAGAAWPSKTGMANIDDGQGDKVYSFVPNGANTKKRPRRRFDEIERLYVCNWTDCEKAYGTLNHLNAHVHMQKHGPKRSPAEFKELRKAWRRHKKAEEEAAKQAAAFHQQQAQNQLQMCEPLLSNMQQAHPLAMHPMSQHHQPQQLPHPHAHPNQHQHPLSQGLPHPHQQHHHHPMGF